MPSVATNRFRRRRRERVAAASDSLPTALTQHTPKKAPSNPESVIGERAEPNRSEASATQQAAGCMVAGRSGGSLPRCQPPGGGGRADRTAGYSRPGLLSMAGGGDCSSSRSSSGSYGARSEQSSRSMSPRADRRPARPPVLHKLRRSATQPHARAPPSTLLSGIALTQGRR